MATIVRPETIRRQNRATVLAALREVGRMSRTEISQNTGLSAATVTTITADLMAAEVLRNVEDVEQSPSTRGRPRITLAFNPEFACIGIIALQLNKITVEVRNYQGTAVAENCVELSTLSLSSGELLAALVDAFKNTMIAGKQDCNKLMHIAVGVQGATDVDENTLLWSPIIKHGNIPVAKFLGDKFKVPVSVHNDCNMIARALRWEEPELYSSDFAAILLSHGIGMGLYQNGQLVQGKHSSATEFGHMVHMPNGALCRCGRHGCIEAYAGDYAIYRRANRNDTSGTPRDDIRFQELEAVLARADNNDKEAVSAYQEAGLAIGAGLASLFALIDPFPVAFVGSGTMAHTLLDEAIRNAIGKTQISHQPIDVSMRYYPEEKPMILNGCAITALMAVDKNIRTNRLLKNKKEMQRVG